MHMVKQIWLGCSFFGDDDGEPAPVLITVCPSEYPSNSDDDNGPSSFKTKVQLLRVSGQMQFNILKRTETEGPW